MMETRSILVLALCLSAAGPVACSSGDDGDGGVVYELPQILPDNNPVCLSRRMISVGESWNQPILLRNDGRQTLEISGVEIMSDERNHFAVQGPDIMSVPSRENATLQVTYTPATDGWDAVLVQVNSNAQNYPMLRVFILALARPAGLDGGTYDPGPPPAEAMMACETDGGS